MKLLSFVFLLATSFFSPFILPPLDCTLQQALDKGYLTAEVEGLGGHSGECLKLKLKNKHSRDLQVKIPAGQIFESADSSLQDLMIAREEVLFVENNQSSTTNLSAFCIEAMRGTPGPASGYRVGKMAAGNLLSFAQYLSDQHQHSNAYAQYAVWAVSNDERLESIGDPELAKYVANLLGKPEPQYHVQYRQPDEDRLLPGTPAVLQRQAFSMNGLFYYTLDRERLVNFELYSLEGELLHAFFKKRRQAKGYHKFRFEFEIRNLPKGKYFARLTSNGQVLKELPVEF